MRDFSFWLLQKAAFGLGSLNGLGGLLQSMGCKNVLLVSDRGLEALGLVGRVETLLRQAGLGCASFLDVEPNPTAQTVEACAKAYQDCGADVTVALGGGSPIDTAKAMRILARFGGKALDYEGTNTVPGALDPLVAIPTTAGTGSEFTNGAVISDHEKIYKTVLADPNMAARHVILDPELIMSMPPAVAASCGADALIHAMEAFLSRVGSPWSDALAEKAMELIGANLRAFVACREDPEAASAMMIGSAMAGAALALGRLGLIHAMSHPISAYYDVPHGIANAVLAPAVVEFNALADRGKYAKVYQYMTGKAPDKDFQACQLIDTWQALNRELGLPDSLSALGIGQEHFDAMIADTMKSPYVNTNPRTFREAEVRQVFQRALHPIK